MKELFKHGIKLLSKSWLNLFLMEIIYRLIANIVLFPFCKWLLNLTLKITKFDFLSLANMSQVLKNPLNDICLLFILAILAFYTLLEISAIILILDQAEKNNNIGIIDLIKESSKRAFNVLKPHNWYLIIFIMFIVPFTSFTKLSNLISEIKVPYFIAERTINVEPWNYLFYILICYLVLFIFPRLLTLYYFILNQDKVSVASKKSRELFKGKHVKTLQSLVLFYLIIIICSGLISLAIDSLGELTIKTITWGMLESYVETSLHNTNEYIFTFFINCMEVFINYAFLSSYYYLENKYRKIEIPCIKFKKNINAKKNNIVFLIILVLIIFSVSMIYNVHFAYVVKANKNNLDLYLNSSTLVIAHRGDHLEAPENTIPAFQKAIDDSANYIELDVQTSKDGKVIVSHDANFKRCTGYNGNVWEMNYDEINKLNAGYQNSNYENTKIPTIDEVLKLSKGKIKVLIELKVNGHDKDIAKKTLEVIKDNNAEDDIMIQSTSYDELKKVKEINPNIKCGYIMTLALGNYKNLPDVDFFSLEMDSISSKDVKLAHKNGKQVLAWTVNDEDDIEKMLEYKVDGIITNRVSDVKNKINEADNVFVNTYKAFLN